MECCPEVNHAPGRHRQSGFHFCDQRYQVGLTFTQQGASKQNFSRHAVAKDPQDLMTNVGAQSIKGYNGRGLVSKDLLEALLIGQVEGHQFLVAGQETLARSVLQWRAHDRGVLGAIPLSCDDDDIGAYRPAQSHPDHILREAMPNSPLLQVDRAGDSADS